jgi:hypothetical protein
MQLTLLAGIVQSSQLPLRQVLCVVFQEFRYLGEVLCPMRMPRVVSFAVPESGRVLCQHLTAHNKLGQELSDLPTKPRER